MQLETNIQTLEPIIFSNISEANLYKSKVSDIINLMKLVGYKGLHNQRVFETAFKDIINQVKNN